MFAWPTQETREYSRAPAHEQRVALDSTTISASEKVHYSCVGTLTHRARVPAIDRLYVTTRSLVVTSSAYNTRRQLSLVETFTDLVLKFAHTRCCLQAQVFCRSQLSSSPRTCSWPRKAAARRLRSAQRASLYLAFYHHLPRSRHLSMYLCQSSMHDFHARVDCLLTTSLPNAVGSLATSSHARRNVRLCSICW